MKVTAEGSILLCNYGLEPDKYEVNISCASFSSCVSILQLQTSKSCEDQVEPKHVNEATRLLRKSIIRVEIPDINLGASSQSQDPGASQGF